MADPYIILNGHLPGPVGSVATQLHETNITVHCQHAVNLYQFLISDDKSLLTLNITPEANTCVVGLPNSSKVRILHCIRIGASGLGDISPTDDQILVMHGDGNNDIRPPALLVLPPNILKQRETLCMTEEMFELNLTVPDFNWPLVPRIQAHEVNSTVNIMWNAPIPAFLVLDGFMSDVNAAELLKQIASFDNTDREMYTHLKNFLRACLTSHNQGDNCPCLDPNHLFTPVPAQAQVWAQEKFPKCSPGLAPPPPAPPAQPDAGSAGIQNDQIANILAQFFNMQQQQQNQQVQVKEKKDEENLAAMLGMAEEELNTTLAMCGLPQGTNLALLPTWIQQCAVKGTSDAYKKIIIRKHIMSHSQYKDAEVPLSNSILKMVAKKNWLGDEANVTCPWLGNAGTGLLPFIVLHMDEDEVAALNMEDDALSATSLVKPSELLAARKRAKAQVPKTADGFLSML
jgi:hypothetical protein